jgi:hypothetical protein
VPGSQSAHPLLAIAARVAPGQVAAGLATRAGITGGHARGQPPGACSQDAWHRAATLAASPVPSTATRQPLAAGTGAHKENVQACVCVTPAVSTRSSWLRRLMPSSAKTLLGWHWTGGPAVADLEPGQRAGNQEADRANRIGPPHVLVRGLRGEVGPHRVPGADVEEDGPGKLHRSRGRRKTSLGG